MIRIFALAVTMVSLFSLTASAATVHRQTLFKFSYFEDTMEYFFSGQGAAILDIQRGKGFGAGDLDRGKVRVFSVVQKSATAELPFSLGSARSSIELSNGTRLYVDHEGRIGKYDFIANKQVDLQPAMPPLGPYDNAYALAISKNEKSVFVYARWTPEISEFSVEDLRFIRVLPVRPAKGEFSTLDNVNEISFEGRRALAVTVSISSSENEDYNDLIVLGLPKGETLREVSGREFGFGFESAYNRRPHVSATGERAIFCEAKVGCRVFDFQTKKMSETFMRDGSTNGSAVFSPDGSLIFAAEGDHLRVLKTADFSVVSSVWSKFSMDPAVSLAGTDILYMSGFANIFFFKADGAFVANVPGTKDRHGFWRDTYLRSARSDGVELLTVNSDREVEQISVTF